MIRAIKGVRTDRTQTLVQNKIKLSLFNSDKGVFQIAPKTQYNFR